MTFIIYSVIIFLWLLCLMIIYRYMLKNYKGIKELKKGTAEKVDVSESIEKKGKK